MKSYTREGYTTSLVRLKVWGTRDQMEVCLGFCVAAKLCASSSTVSGKSEIYATLNTESMLGLQPRTVIECGSNVYMTSQQILFSYYSPAYPLSTISPGAEIITVYSFTHS